MLVGSALLDLARAGGRTSLFVVGTGKNVGKTVAMRAVAQAASARGLVAGLTSMGRDGEAVDVADALAKPRLFLSPGTIVATARNLLAQHPASEVLDFTDWHTPTGTVVFARVRRAGYYEFAGPSTASGIRECVERFASFGCDQTIVDGALDRVAALAGGADAVIVAAGAAAARTIEEAVDDVRALCARLRIPVFDPIKPMMRIDGALTAAIASQLKAAGEQRQIVVRDPTQIAANGKALLGMLAQLDVRCDRPINVVAATVASIGRDRYFEPRFCTSGSAGNRFADVRRLCERVGARRMKFREIVDATTASALQTAWLHAQLEPVSEFGRRAYARVDGRRPRGCEPARVTSFFGRGAANRSIAHRCKDARSCRDA